MMKILIETPKTPDSLNHAKEIVQEEISRAASEATVLLRNEMVRSSPRDTGTLANAWDLQQPVTDGKKIMASTGNSQPHALTIEYGAKAHFPPVENLRGWVQRKITNPVLEEAQTREPTIKGKIELSRKAKDATMQLAKKIAFAIGKRGLPSAQNSLHTGTFSRALERTKGAINIAFVNCTQRITDRLSGGGA